MSEAPHQSASDENLVRRVRAGDDAAARLLFERHLPALRAKARARLPSALRGKVAESDVIQEAWLAAFLALPEFEDRGDGSFGKWLRGILDHKVAYEVRRHGRTAKRDAGREARLATEVGRTIQARGAASPSQDAMALEQASALRGVIDGLADDHAAVIRLVHVEGLTLAQAGERLGRSGDAARKLYGRAFARLAERMRRGPGSTS
jgi:RNA polymerase sigma-70 factor, ECF subfamily